MRWFGQRLAAVVAVAFGFMSVSVIATPGISWASCDPNMSFNPTSRTCTPPPGLPDWYTAPPAYSPSFAAQNVPPPPPPKPWWANNDPQWQVGFHQWGIYLNGVWVPLT
jgi:hypothetical protein